MPVWRRLRLLVLSLVVVVAPMPARAINISVNYAYDTTNFFGAGNPSGNAAGLQAKAALEAAASYFSGILTDTLSAIQTPPTFHSSTFDGQVVWSWTLNFDHPSAGGSVTLTNQTIPANQYIIFAGAKSLSSNTTGVGGPGGYGWSSNPTGGFTQAEINQLNAITASFQDAVERRGEPTGFARWGGAITFDRDGSTPWHYDHNSSPAANTTDFFSTAIHELGHALGFGASAEWNALVSGSSFNGANAKALNGGVALPLAPGNGHWADGTNSVIYGTSTAQETAMDPIILQGTRKRWTALDAAGLRDIGWETVAPTPVGVPGDYDNNGVVNAADYVVWRNNLNLSVTLPNDSTPGTVTNADYTVWRGNFGKTPGSGTTAHLAAVPEPATVILTGIGCLFALYPWRTRRG